MLSTAGRKHGQRTARPRHGDCDCRAWGGVSGGRCVHGLLAGGVLCELLCVVLLSQVVWFRVSRFRARFCIKLLRI